jgi:signal transduction histidine kinase
MLKHGMCVIVVLLLCGLCMVPLAVAAEEELSPIAQKAKAIVEAAHEYVSEHSDDMEAVQKALEEDPRFRDDENELYIFMHAYNAARKEAICIGQGIRPELVGKNMWSLRTPNGRLLFQEEVELIEKQDEFWLEYEWLNPFTEKIETKQSFFKKIVLKDGRNAWVGCGFWKE